jgi:hypothetical protein
MTKMAQKADMYLDSLNIMRFPDPIPANFFQKKPDVSRRSRIREPEKHIGARRVHWHRNLIGHGRA